MDLALQRQEMNVNDDQQLVAIESSVMYAFPVTHSE